MVWTWIVSQSPFFARLIAAILSIQSNIQHPTSNIQHPTAVGVRKSEDENILPEGVFKNKVKSQNNRIVLIVWTVFDPGPATATATAPATAPRLPSVESEVVSVYLQDVFR
jgi:hypothetical protein